jgi:tetratricopeptide (TPR) repeat protein
MTTRFRTLAIILVLGAGLAAAGCGKYSWQALKGQKAWKEANEAYRAQDWKRASDRYEYAIQMDAELFKQAYFFLGNSYDNQYKPARAGEAANDALIQKAVENYKKASEIDPDPKMKKLALEYLVAAYGQDKLNDPTKSEPIVQQMITIDPGEPTNYFALMKIYEDSGRYDEAEQAIMKARDAKPNDPTVYNTMSGFYNRQGDFPKTMEALQKAADLDPKNPEGFQRVATYYWEKAQKDHRLTAAQQKEYITKGIDATDKALALNPGYSEALTYKNILLRMQGNLETDLKKREQLYKEADELRNRAMDINKKKATGQGTK